MNAQRFFEMILAISRVDIAHALRHQRQLLDSPKVWRSGTANSSGPKRIIYKGLIGTHARRVMLCTHQHILVGAILGFELSHLNQTG